MAQPLCKHCRAPIVLDDSSDFVTYRHVGTRKRECAATTATPIRTPALPPGAIVFEPPAEWAQWFMTSTDPAVEPWPMTRHEGMHIEPLQARAAAQAILPLNAHNIIQPPVQHLYAVVFLIRGSHEWQLLIAPEGAEYAFPITIIAP